MKKLTLLFLLTFLANVATHAQLQRADTKESLRGLTGVYVIAQVIDVQPQGMNTNHLVSVVRAALAAADITTTDAPKKPMAMPTCQSPWTLLNKLNCMFMPSPLKWR